MLMAIRYRSVLQILQFPTAAQQLIGEASAGDCRDLFIEYYVQHISTVKLSGIVEIDESLFGRRTKYHRGIARGQKVWIFGLVQRETNHIKLFWLTIEMQRHY